MISSSPPGATARLDGDPATSCSTPCTLQAKPGRHKVVVTAAGHQMESRDILVGEGPLEMAPITLRAAGGILMLTTDPSGAVVNVNGRRMDQLTPANLTLAPGTYNVTVEKNGRQSSDRIEIRDGVTTYRKIPLSQ
jgi:hypothetical protein